MQFLLNQDEICSLKDVEPNTTILQYLRENNLCGVKEGCASGDCGACTLVITELNEQGKLVYKSINSCITLIASIAGKQLITIESLKDNGRLHPVQEAMVKNHASQCGFCTPGFVMSLFSLWKNKPTFDRNKVIEFLSGNLCRCTGYRPIIDAACSLPNYKYKDHFEKNKNKTIAILKKIQITNKNNYIKNKHKFFSPTSTKELSDLLLEYPKAYLLAGGTDLCLHITQAYRELPEIIYLDNIKKLKTIQENKDNIQIGAAATYSAVFKILTKFYPSTKELLLRLGSLQIRNQGTIGGNIGNASPIGDMLPILISLDATIELVRGEKKRIIPIKNYFIDYKQTCLQLSEWISKIIIPKLQKDEYFKVYKISKRLDDDISAVCGAFRLTIKNSKVADVRFAYGGMAAIPKRAYKCESYIIGKKWNLQNLIQAQLFIKKDFSPIGDLRASANYRSTIASNLLFKFYHQTTNNSLTEINEI